MNKHDVNIYKHLFINMYLKRGNTCCCRVNVKCLNQEKQKLLYIIIWKYSVSSCFKTQSFEIIQIVDVMLTYIKTNSI